MLLCKGLSLIFHKKQYRLGYFLSENNRNVNQVTLLSAHEKGWFGILAIR